MRSVRALVEGVWMVVTAPILLAGITVVSLLVAVPFGLMLNSHVQASLANQPPTYQGSVEIDPEWWSEFRAHAQGLDATFTPTVIGFAAPLDNLSALLDGSTRPLALAGPILLSALVWAFLWGGIFQRFVRGRREGPVAFWAAGFRFLARFAIISVVAGAASLLLYLTVHAVLFGPVYQWLASATSSERQAFFWRVALYAIFGALLMLVSLAADYARISTVWAPATSAAGAIAAGVRFIRANLGGVILLYLLAGALFVGLLTVYGGIDVYGGSRVGGWRGVLIAQAFIVARLALRLVFAASEARFFKQLRGGRRL
jgi:hypothetical protein